MSSSHGVQLESGTIFRYSFTDQEESKTEPSLCQTITSHVTFWVRVRKKRKKEKEKNRNQENRIKVRWKRGKKERKRNNDIKTNESWRKGRKGRRKEGEGSIKIKTWNEIRKRRLINVP